MKWGSVQILYCKGTSTLDPNEYVYSGSKDADTLCLTPIAVKFEGLVSRKKKEKIYL